MARIAAKDKNDTYIILCNCGREWPYYPSHSTVCLNCGYVPDLNRLLSTDEYPDYYDDTDDRDCVYQVTPEGVLPTWRSMKGGDYNEFMDWVEMGLAREWTKGENKYQSHIYGFQGYPLDHAIEEALNLLCYLFMEKRRQTHNGV